LDSAALRSIIEDMMNAKRQRFLVKGTYGPLRDGELERARGWGGELAQTMG